jgi:hypothetical protein
MIRRAIINNDQLQIRVRLAQNGIRTFNHKSRVVETGHDDTNFRAGS